MSTTSFTFAIVGKADNPIYELVVSPKKEEPTVNQQNQFFLHAALDIVDEEMWKTNNMFLKVGACLRDANQRHVRPLHSRCPSGFARGPGQTQSHTQAHARQSEAR